MHIIFVDRVKLERQDMMKDNPKTPGAYSVLTLTLSDLDLNDNGTYTCVVTNDTSRAFARISLEGRKDGKHVFLLLVFCQYILL